MKKRLLFAVWLLIGCGPIIPRTELLVVTKAVDNRIMVAGKSGWLYLPKDSTAKIGDTIEVRNLGYREKATLPLITKQPH